MFAKSKQIGLVSLFVVVAAALGGCAESVGNEPASPTANRPSIALSRFVAPQQEPVNFQSVKRESSIARVNAKRVAHPVFGAVH